MSEPKKPKRDLDERVAIPLDPETAIRALLKVDPKGPPVDQDEEEKDEGPAK
jgi:hypothetical protein